MGLSLWLGGFVTCVIASALLTALHRIGARTATIVGITTITLLVGLGHSNTIAPTAAAGITIALALAGTTIAACNRRPACIGCTKTTNKPTHNRKATTMTTSEQILRHAAEVILQAGHTQGRRRDNQGVCVIEAIMTAAKTGGHTPGAAAQATRHLERHLGGEQRAWQWNNHPARSAAEVVHALHSAADLARTAEIPPPPAAPVSTLQDEVDELRRIVSEFIPDTIAELGEIVAETAETTARAVNEWRIIQ